ncbi:MAG: hypothetical protein CME36_04870 [unclassified Hahellaceae]|nr:hypothetical protein [Hahellaceae bacterium]|tara:strand:- start:28789 stop:29607 length:819 start_codon:yes stop_codon:yes gene_type:complete
MSKHKLLGVKPKSGEAQRLQQSLLDYHHYRHEHRSPQSDRTQAVAALQAVQMARLTETHKDLIESPRYHEALVFLLNDLYAPKNLMQRDADLERIFPKIVKLLPQKLLGVMADLTDLNMLTQQLDDRLLDALAEDFAALIKPTTDSEPRETGLAARIAGLSQGEYAAAFRRCDNKDARQRQIQLTRTLGLELERYVTSRSILFALQISEGAAEMAGLAELHGFLMRGFTAFRNMGGVAELLDIVSNRESALLEHLYSHDAETLRHMEKPFKL